MKRNYTKIEIFQCNDCGAHAANIKAHFKTCESAKWEKINNDEDLENQYFDTMW